MFLCPVTLLSGGDLPVNLAQVADDLDVQLLEFTLMAKAREQAAGEAHTAEEAEKVAWRQAETKRIEDLVRLLLCTLRAVPCVYLTSNCLHIGHVVDVSLEKWCALLGPSRAPDIRVRTITPNYVHFAYTARVRSASCATAVVGAAV